MERDDEGQRLCSRQPPEWCGGSRIVDQGDGTVRREPALTYRAFCDPCRDQIRTCIEELPSAYRRLGEALGDRPVTGVSNVRSPFGPSEPIRAEVDALMRTTAAILTGWEVRVRSIKQLVPRDPERDMLSAASVEDAAGTLAEHVNLMIMLQPWWITRVYTFPPGRSRLRPGLTSTCRRCTLRISYSAPSGRWHGADPHACSLGCRHQPTVIMQAVHPEVPEDIEAEIGDAEIVTAGPGWIEVLVQRDGADAGNEILDLHYKARKILGETKTPTETFDGIPCRVEKCDGFTLERAEPPSDPNIPAKMSVCAVCRDTMDAEEFRGHSIRYKNWAESAPLPACRRCQHGRHDECQWQACPCRGCGHTAVAA